MNCHICEHITDFRCHQCDEPVCEDCCVPFTIHNQIDYALCECCHDGNDARRYLRECEEDEIRGAKDKKRKHINEMAYRRYWKPENIVRRRAQREARKEAKIELREKQMEEAIRIVSEMFRGMF